MEPTQTNAINTGVRSMGSVKQPTLFSRLTLYCNPPIASSLLCEYEDEAPYATLFDAIKKRNFVVMQVPEGKQILLDSQNKHIA